MNIDKHRNVAKYLADTHGGDMESPEQESQNTNDNDTKKIVVEDGMFNDFDTYETGWLIGSLTNDGMIRSNNEDAIYTFFSKLNDKDNTPPFGIFIVADGAGGHLNGEVASALTLRTVAKKLIRDIYLPMLNNENMNDVERPTVSEAITTAIQEANTFVLDQVEDGGCTCTVAVVTDNILNVGHVGDSRLYVINKEEIEPITRDHSVVGRLIEIGQITRDEAKTHPQRSVLYRGIGMEGTEQREIEVDIHRKRLKGGDSILICSDGLWDMVDDTFIHETVLKHQLPQEACRTLIRNANLNGGKDNISVVLVSSPVD